MGILLSSQREIEAIRFVQFKTRAQNVQKMVRVGDIIMARISATTCATNRVKNFAYLPDGGARWLNEVVEGLFRLGMISQEAMTAHNSLCEQRREKLRRKYAADELTGAAKELGIVLTKTQLRKIRAVQP